MSLAALLPLVKHLPIVGDIVNIADKTFASPEERDKEIEKFAKKHAEALSKMADVDKVQAQVNIEEIKRGKTWRPTAGQYAAHGFGFAALILPVLDNGHRLYFALAHDMAFAPSYPSIEQIMFVLSGLGGLTAYRTYEKRTGVTK